jgi:hypothetical protein
LFHYRGAFCFLPYSLHAASNFSTIWTNDFQLIHVVVSLITTINLLLEFSYIFLEKHRFQKGSQKCRKKHVWMTYRLCVNLKV